MCIRDSSIAILGSGVPPDLLTTTNNVVVNFSDNSSNFSLIKKGSTLSIKEKFKPLEHFCSDSVISNGPKPLPPIPIHRTSVYFCWFLFLISPFKICFPNSEIESISELISSPIFGDGEIDGFLSQ